MDTLKNTPYKSHQDVYRSIKESYQYKSISELITEVYNHRSMRERILKQIVVEFKKELRQEHVAQFINVLALLETEMGLERLIKEKELQE